MAIEAGQRLLHYRLIEKIGEGGMGVVWKAEDTTLDRQVAIKLLPAAFTDDPERLARFEREAKVLASLNPSRKRRPRRARCTSSRWSSSRDGP
jgi:serine/threonine protein kinase